MGCDQETVRAAEKIILPGDRDRLGCVTQIRVRATCQRDEFSLCTSKFESDHPSHAVGLADVLAAIAPHRTSSAFRRPRRPVFRVQSFLDRTKHRTATQLAAAETSPGTSKFESNLPGWEDSKFGVTQADRLGGGSQ